MADSNNGVIDLKNFRNKKAEEKKRKTERIFFHQLMGTYSVMPAGKLLPIEIIDVSEEGLGIQVPFHSERAWPTETTNIPLRFYLSPESFMEVLVDIKNSKPTIEGGSRYVRYGCTVQKEQRSFAAWKQFVGFLKVYSEVSERDSGNIGVSSF